MLGGPHSLVAQMVNNPQAMQDFHHPVWKVGLGLGLGRPSFESWVRKIPLRREWLLTPVFLPGEPQEQGSLVGYGL